ncbi:hypothetical protein NXC12_CH00428 [Rhizobium etli]|uniref:Transmembrane protein n=1 Tax=Rhizobium etli TaxID=29449 RepID=A0AAN1BDE9_RHIET|nr:hypothetical protein [Rhizobium etli]ARQ08522.1 hypothetical protein NXC12_CH00428 [Rhizobium etli]
MKKATTLRTLFLAATVAVSDTLAGYLVYGDAHVRDHGGAILFAIILMTSVLLVIILSFMSFISFMTEFFINASGARFYKEKTGDPFHYLLWDELRERIERA